jgi:D,D-heptose 1,7-bisphosphate phosphatase
MFIRQAVLLVGGKGTRLGSLTAATPKPLLQIAPDLRFIDVLIEEVARHGFDDIILLAGHLGEQVQALYHGRTVRQARIEVIREPEPAGTGGALRHASHRLGNQFLVANGDALFELNLRALAIPMEKRFIGRLALRAMLDASRYGSVKVQGERVTSFREKTERPAEPGLVNGGVYLLDRAILDHVRELPCSLEMDVFPVLAQQGALTFLQSAGYFLDIGVPDSYARALEEVPQRRRRPAAFLDRDGVLNVDNGHTYRVSDLRWIAGAREAVRALNEAGYYVVVVTNQSGVARGLYTEADVERFHAAMQDDLAGAGAHIDRFYYCPFHAEAQLDAYRHPNHPDRKPNPGMLMRAFAEWPIDRQRSFLIGDKESDLEAARRAAICGALFRGGNLHQQVAGFIADNETRTQVESTHAR